MIFVKNNSSGVRPNRPLTDPKPLRILWIWSGKTTDAILPKQLFEQSDLELRIISRQGVDVWSSEDISSECLIFDLPIVKRVDTNPIWFPAKKFSSQLRSLLLYRRIIKAFQPQVVHVWYDEKPLGLFRVIFTNRNIKFVIHVHDAIPHERKQRSRYMYTYTRFILNLADFITVFSDYVGQMASQRYRLDSKKFRAISMPPTFVESSVRSHPTVCDHQLPVFLLFGTLRMNKGIGLIRDAIRLIPPDIEFQLIISGQVLESEVYPILKDLATDPRVSIQTRYVSGQERRDLFNKVDVILLPYYDFHGESAVLRDAIAHHVPVITSKIEQFTSVADGELGILAEKGSANVWSDCLTFVAENGWWIDQTKSRIESYEKSTSRFMVQEYSSFYRSVLGLSIELEN